MQAYFNSVGQHFPQHIQQEVCLMLKTKKTTFFLIIIIITLSSNIHNMPSSFQTPCSCLEKFTVPAMKAMG